MIVSHYSPHKIARLCFSHEAINRPSGCQATALTIDLKQKMVNSLPNSTNYLRMFFTENFLNFACSCIPNEY
jgi:hypothetical protein